MERPFSSEQKGLKTVIDSLRSRFYTLAEFPFLSGEHFPQNVLEDAMKLQVPEIKGYAFGLKGKELDGLILMLRNSMSPGEIKRASEILLMRISPRILKLLTILFQYYDTSAAINGVLKALAFQMEEWDESSREAAFVRSFGAVDDKINAFCEGIEEREQDIERCLSEFSIVKHSPFANKVALAYLETANREGLLQNLRWVVTTIEYHEKESLEALFKNYLSNLNLSEFHDGINLAILQKIGQPYTSPDWSVYDAALRDKFAQWCYLHQLKLHSIGYPRKFSTLQKYYHQVRSSFVIKEENLMIIDFGEIVVADIANNPYSYFYEKTVFEREMSDWQDSMKREAAWSPESGEDEPERVLPSFIRLDKKNLTARDFIIKEEEAPCVKLSYEGVDILYIQEMLDIKMGLEPDLRRKQLAKIKRGAAGRL